MPVEISSDQRNVTSGKLGREVLWPVVADHHNRSSTAAAATPPAAEKRGRTELQCKAMFPHFLGVLNLDFLRTPVTLKQHFVRTRNAFRTRFTAAPAALIADLRHPYRAKAGSVGNLVFRDIR